MSEGRGDSGGQPTAVWLLRRDSATGSSQVGRPSRGPRAGSREAVRASAASASSPLPRRCRALVQRSRRWGQCSAVGGSCRCEPGLLSRGCSAGVVCGARWLGGGAFGGLDGGSEAAAAGVLCSSGGAGEDRSRRLGHLGAPPLLAVCDPARRGLDARSAEADTPRSLAVGLSVLGAAAAVGLGAGPWRRWARRGRSQARPGCTAACRPLGLRGWAGSHRLRAHGVAAGRAGCGSAASPLVRPRCRALQHPTSSVVAEGDTRAVRCSASANTG